MQVHPNPKPAKPAKPATADSSPDDPQRVKARVLMAGTFGAPNDVIELSHDEAEAGLAAGELDTAAAAVAYAEAQLAA